MSFKQLSFYLGCAVSMIVALPVFAIASGVALFVYAVCAEVGEFIFGGSKKPEASNAREMARLMCLGN